MLVVALHLAVWTFDASLNGKVECYVRAWDHGGLCLAILVKGVGVK